MTLCALIGDDPVGRYVASRAGQSLAGATVIGLEGARPWLGIMIAGVEFVGVLEFGRFRSMLQNRGVTHLVFAGGVANSLRSPRWDWVALRYLKSQPGFWIPHSYLQALQKMLSDNSISLRSVVDIFPSLGSPRAWWRISIEGTTRRAILVQPSDMSGVYRYDGCGSRTSSIAAGD
jgi:hypothetical protein